MTAPDGTTRPEDQVAAARVAMEAVADLIAEGVEVVITHGNGPQVGNLLVKNELAAHLVPPVPLDWCGAQTQGTLGVVLMNALDGALAARNLSRPSAALVTRTSVDREDPAFARPSKPVGRYVTAAEAAPMIEHGETWEDRGERGWRRMVASPEPLEVLDAGAVTALVDAGFVVVANGGGGVPTARNGDGTLVGCEAVIDKDLGAALLARELDVDMLVIVTDVRYAVLAFGTPGAKDIGQISLDELRDHAADGHFASGSMGPKVEAICRFVEKSGRPGVITNLDSIVPAVAGLTGTIVTPNRKEQ